MIFDLDETLVHCTYHDSDDSKSTDVTLPIPMDGGGSVEAGFNIRPFCNEMLQFANKHFEVIVFTASHQNYADAILDHLDPTGTLIQHRLYRPSCVKTEEGVYIKDLRVINRDLKDLVLIDNAVFSFGFQLDNGIPIAAYREGATDVEFLSLKNFLDELRKAKDVRKIISRTFRLNEMRNTNIISFIEYYPEEFTEENEEEEVFNIDPDVVTGALARQLECQTPTPDLLPQAERRVSGLFTMLEDRQIRSPPPNFAGKTKSNPGPHLSKEQNSSSVPRKSENTFKKRLSNFGNKHSLEVDTAKDGPKGTLSLEGVRKGAENILEGGSMRSLRGEPYSPIVPPESPLRDGRETVEGEEFKQENLEEIRLERRKTASQRIKQGDPMWKDLDAWMVLRDKLEQKQNKE